MLITMGAVKLAGKSKTIEAAWARSVDCTQKVLAEVRLAAPENRSTFAAPSVTSAQSQPSTWREVRD
jgi:hypothetical protein